MASSSNIVGAMNSQATPRSRKAAHAPCQRRRALRGRQPRPRVRASMRWCRSRQASAAQVRHVEAPSRAMLARRRGRSCGRDAASDLAVVLEDFGPVLDQAVERFLGGALAGDDIVVEALLRWPAAARRSSARPRSPSRWPSSRGRSGRRAGCRGKARVLDHGLEAGEAAERPPLGLHVRVGEPLDVLERGFLVVGIGDDRDALTAELGELLAVGTRRIGEDSRSCRRRRPRPSAGRAR